MKIKLSHGAGGKEGAELINKLILKYLGNDILSKMEDSAVLAGCNKLAFTTDSFIVKPLFFPGGNIGKLAVCGTLNDLAVMGATPKYLSLSHIIEEGFEIEDLETIVKTLGEECRQAGVMVVCGDTKVAENGAVDSIFINTSGIGVFESDKKFSISEAKEGDLIIVSGTIGEHGIAILNARKEISFSSDLISDCAVLYPLIKNMMASGAKIHSMRDATRGGLSAVVNEMGIASQVSVLIKEELVPVTSSVQSVCNLFGFNPMELANEGRVVIAVAKEDAQELVSVMQAHPLGTGAKIIGEVQKKQAFPALLETRLGVKNILEMPRGELLPRIC